MIERIMIPASFMSERGMVIVREPAGTDLRSVIAGLLECTYSKPFVYEDGVVRRLHFSTLFTQSEMVIRAPNMLSLAYTRKMMGFLLFSPTPGHVLVVGLGGGSLTKYCYYQLPHTRITTVEIDENVLAFGDLFDLPPVNGRNAIVQGDAVDYMSRTQDRADIILLDGCDSHGIAPSFRRESFYDGLRGYLSPGGILIMNLVGAMDDRRANLRLIGRAFFDKVIVLEVSDGNQVVFAFKDAGFAPQWHKIDEQAKWLTRRHGLDFSRIAQRLRRTYYRPTGVYG
jgi:spermidine synthase